MNSSFHRNQTSDFILLGLTDNPMIQGFLFVLVLIIYMTTLLADIYIMTLVFIESKLHNPMYFFLSNFSFIDICLTTVVVPQFLDNLRSGRQDISFACCFTQLNFYLFSANMECYLLGMMGFDRYVAICDPLHYSTVMSLKFCCLLVTSCYVVIGLHCLLFTMMTAHLSFCDSSKIHHFFCDVPPLLKLSCSETSTYHWVEYTEGTVIFLVPMLSIASSYTRVISTILKIKTVEGRKKAFSTCSSHLTLVAVSYSSILFMYFKPSTISSLDYDRVVSMVYTVFIPMINPFIYSLRNKNMKNALSKVLGQWKTTGTM